MQKLMTLIATISLAVAMLALPQPAAAKTVSLVAIINGGGTAVMTDLPAGMNMTSWGMGVKLYSDGSAVGHLDCVDLHGDVPGYPGNAKGEFTSWSRNTQGQVTLSGTASIVAIPGGPVLSGVPFTMTIQAFGGAGVGHWTLDVPGVISPFNGGPICQELLTSGQIVMRLMAR